MREQAMAANVEHGSFLGSVDERLEECKWLTSLPNLAQLSLQVLFFPKPFDLQLLPGPFR